MKKLFILFLFIGFSSFSQDCDKLTTLFEDKVTGESYIIAKNSDFFYVKNKRLETVTTTLMIQKPGVVVIFQNDKICSEKGNNIYFLFRDGTRLKTQNINTFDCIKGISLFFIPTNTTDKDELFSLTNKQIETIRIEHTSGSYEFDLSDKESKKYMQTINCLYQKMIATKIP